MDVIATRDLPTQDGFTLRAVLECDDDSTPFDADCYSAANIEAWRQDRWCYVTCVVNASRVGITLGSASISGLEYGSLSEVDCDPLEDAPGFTVVPLGADGKPDDSRAQTLITFANGHGTALVTEAVAEAKATVAKIQEGAA